jgi:acetoin utilization deacetylase AcuC-like enzyme
MPGGFTGKLGLILEGGYDLTALRDSVGATLAALEGAGPAEDAPELVLDARHDADLRLAEQARTRRPATQ